MGVYVADQRPSRVLYQEQIFNREDLSMNTSLFSRQTRVNCYVEYPLKPGTDGPEDHHKSRVCPKVEATMTMRATTMTAT
jgi:hypothetical protein